MKLYSIKTKNWFKLILRGQKQKAENKNDKIILSNDFIINREKRIINKKWKCEWIIKINMKK